MLSGLSSPAASAAALALTALALAVIGVRFTRLVDTLADRTGLGEAIAGAVFVGAVTSLPGLVSTVVGAREGNASFAVSNSLGGIAAQTAFLAVADITYRKANLEHAAASLPNLLQSLGLVTLAALVLMASVGPEVLLMGIHPVSLLLPAVYLYFVHLARSVGARPMWNPQQTPETREDVPASHPDRRPMSRLWTEFAVLASLVALTGYVVARAGLSLVAQTGLSSSFVGTVFTAVVTSMPELVTVIVAVRIGALTLAVANIVGGNMFDLLFVAAADVAYPGGSIYHAIDSSTRFVLSLVVLLTVVLAAGLVRRERKGIGAEGYAILGVYLGGLAVLYVMGG